MCVLHKYLNIAYRFGVRRLDDDGDPQRSQFSLFRIPVARSPIFHLEGATIGLPYVPAHQDMSPVNDFGPGRPIRHFKGPGSVKIK